MDKTNIRNRIGCLPVLRYEPGVSDSTDDNIAIALANYFSERDDRPEDDPPHPEHEGWGTWVIEKTEDALARIVDEVLSNTDNATSPASGGVGSKRLVRRCDCGAGIESVEALYGWFESDYVECQICGSRTDDFPRNTGEAEAAWNRGDLLPPNTKLSQPTDEPR